MHDPRFLFVSRPGTGPGAGSGPVSMDDDLAAPVVWRLVGGNNRGLGQGGSGQSDLAACRAAVKELSAAVSLSRPVVGPSELSGLWVWRLEFDGRSIAVSVRSYLRQRECRYSLVNFLDAVPRARLTTGLVAMPVRREPRLTGAQQPGAGAR